MDKHTSTLAMLSGLQDGWQEYFQAGGMNIRTTDASNNDRSVADTVALMGQHARDAISSDEIAAALKKSGANASRLSDRDIIDKVFRFIRKNITFVEDETQLADIFQQPNGKELLITPPVLLSMNNPRGDCDDFSMLCCSMLQAKGIQCDFVTVAASKANPTEFSHVYCMATTGDGVRVPLDCSHGEYAGWETSRTYRKHIWPVFGFGNRGMGRLGGVMTTNRGMGFVFEKPFVRGLAGVVGLGDCGDDNGCDIDSTDYGTTTIPTVTPLPVSTSSSASSFNWNTILPGLFGSVEKIAQQSTQPAGVQQTVCNAQGVCSTSSTVLPAGATSLSIPGLPGLSTTSGTSLLLLAGGALVLFALMKG